jgi:hypothetical protein
MGSREQIDRCRQGTCDQTPGTRFGLGTMGDGRNKHNLQQRSSMRPHSPYDEALYAASHVGSGVSIQCQYCPGQTFRRSRLRAQDLKHLFFMRYPVRCLRCGQRQTVSFTVAGISVPSHVKQRRARTLGEQKHWAEPMKASLKPKSVGETRSSGTTNEADQG